MKLSSIIYRTLRKEYNKSFSRGVLQHMRMIKKGVCPSAITELKASSGNSLYSESWGTMTLFISPTGDVKLANENWQIKTPAMGDNCATWHRIINPRQLGLNGHNMVVVIKYYGNQQDCGSWYIGNSCTIYCK